MKRKNLILAITLAVLIILAISLIVFSQKKITGNPIEEQCPCLRCLTSNQNAASSSNPQINMDTIPSGDNVYPVAISNQGGC